MDWIWPLYERHVRRGLSRQGEEHPDDDRIEAAFLAVLGESTVTVLVQEPWRGSVRFKRLAHERTADCLDLLREPEAWLARQYGGGKFKLNFHHGRHFVATRNFKPEGTPRWEVLPELADELPS
jgi:hypothetical protein